MIDIDYIDPVIAGLEDVLGTMLHCRIERTGLGSMDNNQSLQSLSGIIGFGGDRVGTIVLSMSESFAIRAASALCQKDFSEIDEEVKQAMGTLTNTVCEGIIAKLSQFHLSKGLPSVVCGNGTKIHFPAKSQPISIPFKSQWGALTLQIGFCS